MCEDSGCTDTLFRASDSHILHNIQQGGGLPVRLPNGARITSIATGELSTPPLLTPVHIFKDEHLDKSLHSVADWTNQGCTVTFTATGLTVLHNASGSIIQRSSKSPAARLWDLSFGQHFLEPSTPPHTSGSCSNVVNHETNSQFVQYVYASFGSPPPSTFKTAVAKGYLRTYSGLTTAIVNKNVPHTPASAKGHLDRNRKGQRSTRATVSSQLNPRQSEEVFDEDVSLDEHIYTSVYPIDDPELAAEYINYSDLPGKFPFQSVKGMNYMLLSYYKGYIHLEVMPDREAASVVAAYRATYAFFKLHNQQPVYQKLDNETSSALESFFKEVHATFQYVPPHNHRANRAERAIRYFKNHFISMLATVDPTCPMSLWDEFIPQAELTANHFIAWAPDPRVCAYEGLHGAAFDFSAHPIAPIGTRVEVYESAEARESWAPHSLAGFYLGPSLNHYRCYRVFVVQTQSVRVSDSLDWFPQSVRMPGSSVSELILAALLDSNAAIRKALASPQHISGGHPFPFDASMTTALRDASNLYAELARPTTAPHISDKPTPLQRVSPPAAEQTPLLQRVSLPAAEQTSPLQRVATDLPHMPAPQVMQEPLPHPLASKAKERAQAKRANNKKSAYRYKKALSKDFTVSQERYKASIGRRFIDNSTDESFHIVDICLRHFTTNRKRKGGSKTPYFKFYSTLTHLSPPLRDVDYEYTPCAEILKQGKGSYTTFLNLSPDVEPMSRGTQYIARAFSMTVEARVPNHQHKFRWHWSNGKRTEPAQGWHPYSGLANRAEKVDPPVLNLDAAGKPLRYGSALKGPHAQEWRYMDGVEISRLIDSKTLAAINRSDCPADRRRDITYYKPVVKEKWNSDAQKVDRRIRGTIGGDRINYPGDVSSATADIFSVKALLHAVVSDRYTKGTDTRFATLDIKDFYLGTPLKRKEYVSIPLKYIPAGIVSKYNLETFISSDSILFEVSKCMYGLPQAGLLSHNHLIGHLALHGYIQDSNVPCLFTHITQDLQFTLVVDDFGVKYSNVADVYELVRILEMEWPIKLDLTGVKYLGYRLTWEYDVNRVTLDMPEYLPKVLARFASGTVLRGADSPALYIPPSKGTPNMGPTPIDTSPEVSAADKQFVMEVNGSMLYYARAIDHLMLPACTTISVSQSRPTQRTVDACWRVINYAYTHQSQQLVFQGCDMVLKIKSDASYLSRPNSGSVAGGFHYCGNRNDDVICGVQFAMSSSIPTVCAAVSEAEYAALFINAQHGAWERTVLAALRYPQIGPTPIETDNKTAEGIAQGTCTMKRSKAIAMRYHWIRDRVSCGEFTVFWAKGKQNLADFFTKPQPDWRHKEFELLLATPPLL